jgi:hypothetical protein
VATESCDNHTFEMAEGLCGQCGRPYCAECLIFVFGPKKPGMCKACAIQAAGIRKNAGRAPAVSKRELKRIAREHRREVKQRDKTKVESAPSVSADMDWTALDADEPTRATRDQGSARVSGIAAGLGFGEEPELHEVRPSFDGRLAQAPG